MSDSPEKEVPPMASAAAAVRPSHQDSKNGTDGDGNAYHHHSSSSSNNNNDDDDDDDDKKSKPMIQGSDIASILESEGPVVKCVLLRHMRKDAKDVKPHPAAAAAATAAATGTHHHHHEHHQHPPAVLTELIDEIEIDTTPSKQEIRKLLGPFTFLGQFPTEGVMVMAPKQLPDETPLAEQSVGQLRAWCQEYDIDTTAMLEKKELVQALEEQVFSWPINPHKLQPPLHHCVVRGDILLLRVAEVEDESESEEEYDNDKDGGDGDNNDVNENDGNNDQEDDNDEEEEDDENVETAINMDNLKVKPNEEFFLNYTKEEYIAFASRTDIVAPPKQRDDDDDDRKPAAKTNPDENGDEEEEQDDDEDDEDYDPTSDASEEDERRAVLNLIMGEVLKKFRTEKGRGPSSEELLELRQQVAAPLGVDVTTLNDIQKKRPAPPNGNNDDDNHNGTITSRPSKRVKFNQEELEEEQQQEEEEESYTEVGDGEQPAAAQADTAS